MPPLTVVSLWKQCALSYAVASQLIGHDHARHILKALKQPSKEALRGFAIPPWLDEDVEHHTILIHGSPKIVLHTLDSDEHLIQMPLVTGPRTTATQAFGKTLAEFLAPASNGLIRDGDASLPQKYPNVSHPEPQTILH